MRPLSKTMAAALLAALEERGLIETSWERIDVDGLLSAGRYLRWRRTPSGDAVAFELLRDLDQRVA